MLQSLMSPIGASLVLVILAGVANLLGSAIVVARPWSRPLLSYFIALGSGFMLATTVTAMIPESLHLAPAHAPFLILLGYLIVHYFEHSLPGHFHFGEETHRDEFLDSSVAYTALTGLVIHTFFGGVSLAASFLVSPWLGMVIFGSIILHNIPEGFTIASIMVAANKGRRAGFWAATALALSRILGVLAMGLHRRVHVGAARGDAAHRAAHQQRGAVPDGVRRGLSPLLPRAPGRPACRADVCLWPAIQSGCSGHTLHPSHPGRWHAVSGHALPEAASHLRSRLFDSKTRLASEPLQSGQSGRQRAGAQLQLQHSDRES